MKKLILLGSMVSLLLVGCSSATDNIVNNYNSTGSINRFQNTGNTYAIDSYNWTEVLDTSTGNLYLTRSGGNTPSGLCPLYNENGQIININDK